MISVLSAVAEIERENIRVQTMEGRMQKAREGKWNPFILKTNPCLFNHFVDVSKLHSGKIINIDFHIQSKFVYRKQMLFSIFSKSQKIV